MLTLEKNTQWETLSVYTIIYTMELNEKSQYFPFLYLPILVIENALRNLDPVELIKFSQVSKRCHRFVKFSTRKNPFKLTLDICFTSRIIIKTGRNSYDMIAPFYDVDSYIYCFLKIFSSAKWTEYILETLNCRINDLSMQSNFCFYSFPFIIDWFSNVTHCLDSASFKGTAITRDHLKMFLETCKSTKTLILFMEQPYEIMPFDFNLHEIDHIYISGPTHALNWVTLDHLMSFDCVDLLLDEFAFTEKDMNNFLKAFLKGSILPRMKYFRIRLLPMNLQLLTDGIEVNQREITVIREYVHEHPLFSIIFRGGTDVHKESGELVTFRQSSPPNPDNPRCKADFKMVVW
ncbi:unnamed protein product [Caenorhabditis brenneri]